MTHHDTIVALATPSGAGAIAVIRLSGETLLILPQKYFIPYLEKTLQSKKLIRYIWATLKMAIEY